MADKKWGEQEIIAIRNMRKQGMTLAQIGQIFEVSSERIRNLLDREDVAAAKVAAAANPVKLKTPFDDYITRADYCKLAGITQRTSELHAHARKGPRVTIINKRAYYHVDDVQKFLDECRNNASREPRKRTPK